MRELRHRHGATGTAEPGGVAQDSASTGLVLGLDPGIATTGFAVLRNAGKELIEANVLTTPAGMAQPARLAMLHRLLGELLSRVGPRAAAVEELFFASNTTTAMQVAEARGVILLALEQAGVPTWQYTPMQVKASLTGYGKAAKPQMVRMVRAVTGTTARLPDDAFDAVAVGLCHIASQRLQPGRKIS